MEDLSIKADIALHTEFLFELNVLDVATIGVGAWVDALKLALDIESVDHVDDKCNPSTNTTLTDEISSRFGDLINVKPEIQLAVGWKAGAGIAVFAETELVSTLTNYSYSAPTGCLAFNKAAVTAAGATSVAGGNPAAFVTASAALESATASAVTASATAKSQGTTFMLDRSISGAGISFLMALFWAVVVL